MTRILRIDELERLPVVLAGHKAPVSARLPAGDEAARAAGDTQRAIFKALVIALLLSFAWVGGAAAAAIESFILPDQLPADDDGSSAAVPIGFPINFFGVTHTELFVNNNGNVTFGAALSTFTPFGLVGTETAIIAPFFADVDTRGAGSGIVRFGTPPGRPDLFVVNWNSVGYYDQKDDKLNSFQLILQDLSAVPSFAPGDFRIVFNYDRIQWETGDASGGTNGRGGESARVGFSSGSGRPGTFFELPGSAQDGALLNGGSHSLVRNRVPSIDTSLPLGRYQFLVKNGTVAQADLAIAAEIIEEGNIIGFDLVVRNFGPSDAGGGPSDFGAVVFFEPSRDVVIAVSPRRFCKVLDVEAACHFDIIRDGGSRRIRVITTEADSGGTAVVQGPVFDADLSNNRARAGRCRGEILSRSAPDSVRYEPTPTEPARQRLRLAMINPNQDRDVEIQRIRLVDRYTDPASGSPLRIDGIEPPLPATIEPGGSRLFRVDTSVPAGMPARDASRPYFRFTCVN